MSTVRIANCSGFYGDRLSAAREMVEGGPIDFLTGDYLAELTMAILWRTRSRQGDGGYARTFLRQMEEVMGTCLERGIRVVVNAGGLNPRGLAAQLSQLGERLGVRPRVAAVEGDDLISRLDEVALEPFEDGPGLGPGPVVTANAYLGCWGIVSALDRGADIVVTGRVTDAALVMGPAAHSFRWRPDDLDPLAGALVAGHVLECGAQATGGNYSFFTEVPGIAHVGFPLVEMAADGSFVVTKHPGTGGAVTTETVTAQLLYEIAGPRYANPDVVARFDTIRLRPDGPDRVAVGGVVGEPPSPDLKVAVNELGGYRNEVTFVLTGLAIEEKAAVMEESLWRRLGGRESFARVDTQLLRGDREDPASNEEAMARLRVVVYDPDPDKVGRAFSGAAVEFALAGYPGFFLTAPPTDATPYAVYRPMRVAARSVPAVVHFEGETWEVPSPPPLPFCGSEPPPEDAFPTHKTGEGETARVPLGLVVGARSGDKGGDANVGVWVRKPDAYPWLAATLTVERFKALIPEAASLEVERHPFPNLGALNFVVRGLLGEGVAASSRVDPQAKSLGEYLRAKWVDVPTEFLPEMSG